MSQKKREGTRGMWRRMGDGADGFQYLRGDGKPLKSRPALLRIAALAIPPGWTDVRIAPLATDKVQAIGYDAAGRKQYIYNPGFVQTRSRRKFRRIEAFARVLPRLRTATDEHLSGKGVGRERVLATVVRLMCRGYFRIGSERYAVENRTFGIATLQKKHLTIEGSDLVFRYKGKRRIDQRRVVAETPLVEIIEELLELPGKRLFRYLDESGNVRDVTAHDVNEYLEEILGERFTSKDIRTWGGTVRAALILADLGPAEKAKEAQKNLTLTCKLVSTELGNTPAICRSSYIHPVVLEKYLKGSTIAPVMRSEERVPEAEGETAYYPEEAALMRFLEGARR